MRKTLLCAALLAATLATSVAQNVYSLNVVGYVNVPVAGAPAGYYTMVANPLNTTNNTIGSLIAAPPEFTTLFKYTGSGFAIATYFLGAWDNGSFSLNPGEGCIIQANESFTNTFVGEVMQGNLTNSYPVGFSIRASMVPQAGTLTQLGLPGSQLSDFDEVYRFNTATQGYDISTWFFGSWSGAGEPSLKVGEAMWLNTGAAGNWVRSFTVQ